MPPKYDEDDYYGAYDEDDYYDEGDEYDEYDDVPQQQPTKGAPKGGAGNKGATTSAAAKAPAATAAKKEPVATALQRPLYPPTPGPAAAPSALSGPSPDDRVKAAQSQQGASSTAGGAAAVQPPTSSTSTAAGASGKGPQGSSSAKGPPPGFIHLPPSKAMLAQNEKRMAAAAAATAAASGSAASQQGTARHDVDKLSQGLAGTSLGGAGASNQGEGTAQAPGVGSQAQAGDAATAAALAGRRRISEYVQEPDLARECAAAAEAESGGGGGGQGGAKPSLHLVVLGHVDAGKSTLMGRLLHDLGLVSAKDVHKNQREAAAAGKASFAWAWLLDERPEERARGVTVDVATTRFSTPRFNVTLLDAPGHRDFVPNMIGGAAQADAALLLVDGSPGGFEAGFEGSGAEGSGSGQTREHAQLARSLGVEQLAVVVSKLDMAGYSQERFESIRSQLAPFLQSVCGYKESKVQWLPAVGPEGQNLAQPPTEPGLAAWWKGPTVVQAIDAFTPRERLIGRPLRLPVTDVFKSKSGALVVGGKLEAGAARAGTKVVVVPGMQVATVKGIEVDGKACPLARAGDAVELSLAGLDVSTLGSGVVLCHPDYPVPLVTKFEARIVVLETPVPLLKGQSVTVHAHVAREAGHVSALVSLLNPRTGEVTKAKPRCLIKGQSGVVEVTLSRGMCLEEYGDLKALGRVALREGGRTLAVGVVTRLIS